MSAIENYFTMKEAAVELGVTTSRVRQLCLAHDIGTKLGQYRLLHADDMKRLRAIPRKIGRPKNRS